MKVCCVVGFPLGAQPPETKAMEARAAIRQGAKEIDMVINVGALKSGDDELVLRDIRGVVEACRDGSAKSKVILETSLLTNEEKARACELAVKAHADFVKTSTGFSSGGATVEDVSLMSRIVRDKGLGVKASGDVRSLADLLKMVAAGATRIGTSSGLKILKEAAGEVDFRRKARSINGRRKEWNMADLRSYIFLDSLQPQVASFFATVSQGFLPIAGQASLFVEISPGMEINRVTDVALKSTKVTPGCRSSSACMGCSKSIPNRRRMCARPVPRFLRRSNLKEEGRYKPQIFSSSVIRRIDDYHTMLINRTRHGNMILPGHTLVHHGMRAGRVRRVRRERSREGRGDQHSRNPRVWQFRPHLPRRRREGHRRGRQGRRAGDQQRHRPGDEGQRRRLERN